MRPGVKPGRVQVLGLPCVGKRKYFVYQRRNLKGTRSFRVVRRSQDRSASRGEVLVRAQQAPNSGEQNFGLTPAKPKTSYGEMLQYYLQMEPQLFYSAVEDQLNKLKQQKEAEEAKEKKSESSGNSSGDELVLSQRIEQLQVTERRATVEDLMYVSVLEKFMRLNIDMMPRMDGVVDIRDLELDVLMEGVHTQEALEMVRDHLLAVMGPTNTVPSHLPLRMSKLQMAQVYATSVMFGYFLRRVDRRFQLEKALGTLNLSSNSEDAVSKLEKLFAQADAYGEDQDPDAPPPLKESNTEKESEKQQVDKHSKVLKKYVEQFDQQTMLETSRLVSIEGAALVERQTTALFGDVKLLQKEMQAAVGQDFISLEELMQRVQQAVLEQRVSTITMAIATQRRAVLEAVAFGAFLRDIETWIQDDYNLLTPLPPPKGLGPGTGGSMGPMGPGGPLGGSGPQQGPPKQL